MQERINYNFENVLQLLVIIQGKEEELKLQTKFEAIPDIYKPKIIPEVEA